MAFPPTDWGGWAPEEYEVGAAGTSNHFERWFRNPVAITQGSPGSPYEFSTWRPYDSTMNGDGKTGVLYDHAVHGTVSQITSPIFEPGWDYRFVLDALLNQGLRAAVNNGAWRPATDITTTTGGANRINGMLEMIAPMRGGWYSEISGYAHRDDTGGENIWGTPAPMATYRMRNTGKPPVSQVQFSGGTSFSAGRALMFRRRSLF